MLEQDRSVQSGAVTTVAAPQATDAYLATIVRVSSEAIIGAAGDGTIQSWNPAAERIFGYTAAEAVGRSIAFLAPLGHEAEQQAIIARLRAGQAASVETVRRAKDGRAVHVLLNAAPVLDVAGQLVLIATTLTDITPRKRAEAALRASADRLRRIIDVESVGIIFFHVDGRITGSNRAFLRMSGYSQADLDHGLVRWDSMTPPEYMPQSRQAVAEFRAHGRISPYEKEYIRKDGSRWWGVFAGMRLDDDQGAEFIIDITERKRAEEALRDSEERFRQLAEALDECVWVFCTDTRRLIYVSPAYETIWGRSRSALAADAIWPDALHPDDREHVLGRLAACVAGDGDYNAEYRIIRSDGTIRWIAERAFPIRNARGETYRLAGISSDITAQKQAEQEIQRLNADLEQRVVERTAELAAANRDLKHEIAERQRVEAAARAEYAFRTAIEAANVSGVVAADLTGRTFYVNPAFCRLVGWREDELLGELPPYRYWPDEEITHLRHALEQALTGKAPPGGLEVRFRRCTGERFDALVLVAPLQDEHGQQIGSIGSIYDITERKRAEAARHASERKYRLLLEQAADGIFVAAPDGTYIEVNTEGCRMLGYTREEILRLNMRDVVPEEDQAQTPIRWGALQSGATVTSERRLQRKDGSFLVAEINAKRLDNGDLQGIVRDITARKQAEARLQESERRLAESQRLAHLGWWEWEIGANRVTWSDELYRIFGLQPQQFEATFEALLERVHPDDRGRVQQNVERALQDHGTYSAGARIRRADGMLRYIQSQVKVELDSHNRPRKLVGASQDVTAQKEVELRLQREAARTNVLLRVAARLNQELDVDAVLNAVCDETRRVLNVAIAAVALVDREHDLLVPAVNAGVPAEYQALLEPLPCRVYDSLTYPHDYLIIPDAASLPEPVNREVRNALNIRTIVTMNIMRRGELVGTLSVMTRDAVRQFTDDELALLRGLADQAGQAIANAQLFEQVRTTGVQLRQLTQQVVSAQEAERRRLSRELHDEAGQALTGLEISLQLIHADLPPSEAALGRRLNDAIALTGATMDQIRLLAQDLRPAALDTVGLNLTLEGFCDSFAARTGLPVSYSGIEAPPLPDTINIALYRLLQEALTNVAKHAHAKRIRVALQYDGAAITLSIEDDGRGFDKRAVVAGSSYHAGIGLVGMQERLEVLGGRLEIQTEQGQGTRLVASVPLE